MLGGPPFIRDRRRWPSPAWTCPTSGRPWSDERVTVTRTVVVLDGRRAEAVVLVVGDEEEVVGEEVIVGEEAIVGEEVIAVG